MEYTAGRGTTALGIIGTTLGGLAVAGNGLLGNVMGANNANAMPYANACNCGGGNCSENMLVNRYEATQSARIAELETEVKLRDSNIYTDQKSLALYQYIDGQLTEIRKSLCDQAVINQKTADSFALAQSDLAATKAELKSEINMEAERRCCGDNSIVNYANATFYPKQIADVTVGTTSVAQTLYNPLPKCGCCNN